MRVCVVTGSGGLIGSESVRFFGERGFDVLGIDNDLRASFFGSDASTAPVTAELARALPSFRHLALDIRDRAAVEAVFAEHGTAIELIVHAAAQPSHDWAASDPHTDFGVNAVGTLNLLEATRQHAPGASFVFCSTNKVYGDRPNDLPLFETATRLELGPAHPYHDGIGTDMPIDGCTHSLFGVSKASADLMVQEYGRYFGMNTVCFRGGCMSGPRHAGAQMHGFLSYLMKCAVTSLPYTVFGYGGKQVRDNMHALDVVRAFTAYHADPRPAAVYNLGGGRGSNVSMLEAIALCERITGEPMNVTFSEQARIGDHRWWISDLAAFEADYPDWSLTYGTEDILRDIHAHNAERWLAALSLA